ncbi:MAG TPA: FeoA family protein, partial [Balneolaceae bacterium]|nr:FeoA family protein [Balneolaceae bacterium]
AFEVVLITMKNVTQLKENEIAVVRKITAPEPLRSRLLGLGIIRGAHVRLKTHTLTKQTWEIEIDSTNVALRNEEAAQIQLREQSSRRYA